MSKKKNTELIITKEELLKLQQAARRLEAIKMNNRNAVFQDKRTKRNRTRSDQKRTSIDDQVS